jgi:hypothetical protein
MFKGPTLVLENGKPQLETQNQTALTFGRQSDIRLFHSVPASDGFGRTYPVKS